MHSSVTFLFVLSLVVAALAGEEPKGRHRRGPRKHPAKIIFPACETFVDAMDNSAHKKKMNTRAILAAIKKLPQVNIATIQGRLEIVEHDSVVQVESVRGDLMKANQIGPDACPDESPEDCMKTDVRKVRCSVDEAPSEECIAQLTAFLQGNTCNE